MTKKKNQTPAFEQNPGVLIGKDQMNGFIVFVKSVEKEARSDDQCAPSPQN